MQTRPLNQEKYDISKYRFRELYYFCLQYNEWKEELKHNTDALKSVNLDGMPRGTGISDQTGALATRRVMLDRKCKLIEQTAIEVDSEIYQYLIQAVTNELITYEYLRMRMGIPCGKNVYYDRRRKFYWVLSQKM